jgi:arginine deiminase
MSAARGNGGSRVAPLRSVVSAGGNVVSQIQGVDSEIGQLRTVLMHRPGPELERVTPRHSGRLLLRTLPWVTKARQEHDLLCEQLREQGAEVLYFTALLQDTLEYQPARTEAVRMAVADVGLGDELRGQLRSHLEDLPPEQLAQVLIAGLTRDELKIGQGVVFELLDRHDFVLDPLPNLVFTKDSSFWIGDQVAVASLAAPFRRRETGLATVVYRHHPRFAGTKWIYQAGLENLDGGDVMLLAPGVVAIGVGQRTTPAGTERLARRLFDASLAHTVLAVPVRQHGDRHLDTLCAVLDTDAVLMHPSVAYALTAHTISPRGDGMRASRAQPFLEAAAQAMGIERLHVIDSGLDPLWGESGQGDDGSNVLAIGRRVVVSHERNSETNARLEQAGVRVIRVPSSELGSLRGGPRCMTCPVGREPAAQAADEAQSLPSATLSGGRTGALLGGGLPGGEIALPGAREAVTPERIPAGASASAGSPQPGPANAGRRPAELAQAGLPAAARPARRPAAQPEYSGRGADEQHDQRDQRKPEECLDNGGRHEDDDDGADDYQQHAEHSSTVRRRYGALVGRPVRRPPAAPGRRRAPGTEIRRIGRFPGRYRGKSGPTGRRDTPI